VAAARPPAPTPVTGEPQARKPVPEPVPLPEPGFEPDNDIETAMLAAVQVGDTDAYLKALLLAELLVPIADGAPVESRAWRATELDGERCVLVFTSQRRMVEHLGSDEVPYTRVEAVAALHSWPDHQLTLAVNPGTAVGASLPGEQVAELAAWAAEIGLVDILQGTAPAPGRAPAPATPASAAAPPASISPSPLPAGPAAGTAPASAVVSVPAPDAASGPAVRYGGQVLQKLLPHQHVDFYLQRGYHMVSGYIHRLRDVGEATPPAQLYQALGLDGAGSPFAAADPHLHAVRWPAYGDGRYGATDPPSYGAGAQVSQLRVAGVPLPHGAQLCRIDRTGAGTVVATYDADAGQWRTGGGLG
ncbi:MAG: SseB family protein, partial [Micromonosporaceae bacterium]